MKKRFKTIESALITHISEVVHVKRDNVPDLYKRIITVVEPDEQTSFCELRNAKLKLFERLQLQEGDNVLIEYSHEGSEKNGKKYNNIYINNISKL